MFSMALTFGLLWPLFVIKAIVEQHGSSLEVYSEPGGGTYAQIRLPLRD